VKFQVKVVNDPDGEFKGVYQAEVSPAGLTLRKARKEVAALPVGVSARYRDKKQFSLPVEGRDVTLAVSQLNLYQEHLARDVVRFLKGTRNALDAADYTIPWYVLLPALLPVGIIAIGVQFGAIGGGLGGGLGAGLVGANLSIVRKRQWPLAARLGACLGLSAVGYGLVVAVLLLLLVRFPRDGLAPNQPQPQEQPLASRPAAPPAPPANPAAPATAPRTPPPPTGMDGLIAYWSFDEGVGTTVADGAGKSHQGTLTGAQWVPGIQGHAVQFAGHGYFDYGTSGDFNFVRNEPFTFAGWVQTREGQGPVFSQRHAQEGSPVIDITVEGGRLSAVVREDGNEFARYAALTGKPVNDGQWHHFALVRHGGNEVELFVDGAAQGRSVGANCGGPITTNLRTAGSEQYWARKGGGTPFLNGAIDELCIFKRDLKREEIQRLAGR
jgi:hypothetical protein